MQNCRPGFDIFILTFTFIIDLVQCKTNVKQNERFNYFNLWCFSQLITEVYVPVIRRDPYFPACKGPSPRVNWADG